MRAPTSCARCRRRCGRGGTNRSRPSRSSRRRAARARARARAAATLARRVRVRHCSKSSGSSGKGSACVDRVELEPPVRPVRRSCGGGSRGSGRAPRRARRPGGASTQAIPTRQGNDRGSSRTPRPSPSREAPRERVAEVRRPRAGGREIELAVAHTEQHRASGRRSRNWYTSSCHCHASPRCAHAGMSRSHTSAANVCVHG